MIRAQDIAIAAGVSKTTVSYVFSPEKVQLISPATRERVLVTARRLGYRPSYLGKALSMKRSYNVALVLPARCANNMSVHLLQIFHGVAQCAETSEYNVSVFFGAGKRLFDRLSDHRLDGIIVIGVASDRGLLDRLAALELPMAVINRDYAAGAHVGCIRSDLAGWCHAEITRLARQGCRNLLILNKNSQMDAGCVVAAQVQQEMARTTATTPKLSLVTMEDDLGPQCRKLLTRSPHYDGILINGSGGAIVAEAAQSVNLRPGRDFLMSGFVVSSNLCYPGCDWVYNSRQLGIRGWRLLERLLAGEKSPPPELLPIMPLSAVQDALEVQNLNFDL